jgi:hypothetical protein
MQAILLCGLVTSMGEAGDLEPGVRGVATRATGPVTIDGNLEEFASAFATPAGSPCLRRICHVRNRYTRSSSFLL